MKTSHLLACTVALSNVSLAGYAEMGIGQSKKPNVIFILADDLGRADIGCYGQQLIETPNIDRLAESGMIFTDHYCGTAVSAPSRCVLFTGKHTGHAYIRGNDEMDSRGNVWDREAMLADSTLEGQRSLPANTIMIPAVMKKAGYVTACIGKWGLGYPGSESTPNKMGFDFFYGYNCQRQAHDYFPPFLYRNENREYLSNPLRPFPNEKLDEGADPQEERSYAKYWKGEYAPDLMYKEIINFVTCSKDDPFVLFWTTPVPHLPLIAPDRWVKHYVKKFGDERPYDGRNGSLPCRYPHATYAAMISYFDEQIGGLVAKLKELGIYENTVIMFTSDNGPAFNGGSDSPWFDSAKPFKSEFGWGKTSLREGGIRAPLIVSWPECIKPGKSSGLVSAFWDIMPTLCDIAGVESPETDGVSLLPELLGNSSGQQKHECLYWEYPEFGGMVAVRMGKWKAFIPQVMKGNKAIELYDLETDPREHTDVAKYYPEVVRKMKKLIKSEHSKPELEWFDMPIDSVCGE